MKFLVPLEKLFVIIKECIMCFNSFNKHSITALSLFILLIIMCLYFRSYN